MQNFMLPSLSVHHPHSSKPKLHHQKPLKSKLQMQCNDNGSIRDCETKQQHIEIPANKNDNNPKSYFSDPNSYSINLRVRSNIHKMVRVILGKNGMLISRLFVSTLIILECQLITCRNGVIQMRL